LPFERNQSKGKIVLLEYRVLEWKNRVNEIQSNEKKNNKLGTFHAKTSNRCRDENSEKILFTLKLYFMVVKSIP